MNIDRPRTNHDEQRQQRQDEAALLQSLTEVLQKVEASLQPKIEEHVAQHHHADTSSSNNNAAGLDFLDTKNSLLLSYLIELTYHLRGRLQQQSEPAAATAALSRHRLTVLRTALDKLRALDQKLRYQIDKLLAHGAAAHGGAFAQHNDPLQFRPAAAEESGDGSEDDDDDSSSSSSSEDDDEAHPKKASGNKKNEAEDDIDEDLAAARRTMALAKQKKDKHRRTNNNNSKTRRRPQQQC